MGLDEIGNLPPFGMIRNGQFTLLCTKRCHWAQLCESETGNLYNFMLHRS